MAFNDIYCFSVHYGFDMDGWKEKDEYGFIAANSFEDALAQLRGYYGNDILSFSLENIGDTGIIPIGNKELVESFRKSFIKYHYGPEEDEE